jgi:hypothetical protein
LITPLQALQGLMILYIPVRRALPYAIDYALSELITSSDHDRALPSMKMMTFQVINAICFPYLYFRPPYFYFRFLPFAVKFYVDPDRSSTLSGRCNNDLSGCEAADRVIRSKLFLPVPLQILLFQVWFRRA